MSLRLTLVALAQAPWQVLAVQVLDGLANGLFAVLAAAWVSDRFADPRIRCLVILQAQQPSSPNLDRTIEDRDRENDEQADNSE